MIETRRVTPTIDKILRFVMKSHSENWDCFKMNKKNMNIIYYLISHENTH